MTSKLSAFTNAARAQVRFPWHFSFRFGYGDHYSEAVKKGETAGRERVLERHKLGERDHRSICPGSRTSRKVKASKGWSWSHVTLRKDASLLSVHGRCSSAIACSYPQPVVLRPPFSSGISWCRILVVVGSRAWSMLTFLLILPQMVPRLLLSLVSLLLLLVSLWTGTSALETTLTGIFTYFHAQCMYIRIIYRLFTPYSDM